MIRAPTSVPRVAVWAPAAFTFLLGSHFLRDFVYWLFHTNMLQSVLQVTRCPQHWPHVPMSSRSTASDVTRVFGSYRRGCGEHWHGAEVTVSPRLSQLRTLRRLRSAQSTPPGHSHGTGDIPGLSLHLAGGAPEAFASCYLDITFSQGGRNAFLLSSSDQSSGFLLHTAVKIEGPQLARQAVSLLGGIRPLVPEGQPKDSRQEGGIPPLWANDLV